MAIFGNILGHHEIDTTPGEDVECPHTVLVARWDDLEAMGHEDRASHFECVACNEQFSPEKAKEIRQKANERIHEVADI